MFEAISTRSKVLVGTAVVGIIAGIVSVVKDLRDNAVCCDCECCEEACENAVEALADPTV